jgi:hypothetical protein
MTYKTEIAKEECGNCKYFKQSLTESCDDIGRCTRYPPGLISFSKAEFEDATLDDVLFENTHFPVVGNYERCGEYLKSERTRALPYDEHQIKQLVVLTIDAHRDYLQKISTGEIKPTAEIDEVFDGLLKTIKNIIKTIQNREVK